MNWDTHEGVKHFFGSSPVDMDSPPSVGETASLTKNGCAFDVMIDVVSDGDLFGVVQRISRGTVQETYGIKLGDHVHFQIAHIHTLHRAK